VGLAHRPAATEHRRPAQPVGAGGVGAQAVERGELRLDDPVAKYLTELQRGGDIRRVTLGQLASHPLISGKVGAAPDTSGSRRFPSYLNPRTFALTFLDTVAPPDPAGTPRSSARTLPAR